MTQLRFARVDELPTNGAERKRGDHSRRLLVLRVLQEAAHPLTYAEIAQRLFVIAPEYKRKWNGGNGLVCVAVRELPVDYLAGGLIRLRR